MHFSSDIPLNKQLPILPQVHKTPAEGALQPFPHHTAQYFEAVGPVPQLMLHAQLHLEDV